MSNIIENLQKKREKLYEQLQGIGDFRRGTISVNFRKCGKPKCRCAKKGAKGHGPQYLWTATINNKSVSKNLKIGVVLEKYINETERYRKFLGVCDELVKVNEQLCNTRPIIEPESEEELESLKKKLQKQLLMKRKRK